MIGHFIQLTAVLIRCFSVRIGIRANCIETYETYETKPKQTSVSVTETDTKLGFSFNTFLSITDPIVFCVDPRVRVRCLHRSMTITL